MRDMVHNDKRVKSVSMTPPKQGRHKRNTAKRTRSLSCLLPPFRFNRRVQNSFEISSRISHGTVFSCPGLRKSLLSAMPCHAPSTVKSRGQDSRQHTIVCKKTNQSSGNKKYHAQKVPRCNGQTNTRFHAVSLRFARNAFPPLPSHHPFRLLHTIVAAYKNQGDLIPFPHVTLIRFISVVSPFFIFPVELILHQQGRWDFFFISSINHSVL